MYNKCIKAHYVSLIDINNISHKLNYTKFSIIITPKLNFSREKNVMSKNKLLIYLLSTTLVFPTFTTPTAVAKDNTDDINQQTKVTHKVHSRKKINKSKLIAINVRIKQKKLLLRNLLLKRTVNLLKRIIKIMMLKRIKQNI